MRLWTLYAFIQTNIFTGIASEIAFVPSQLFIPSQDEGPVNFRGTRSAQLKTIALNPGPLILAISQMFYFLFILNFLSYTQCVVLDCCGVLQHPTKVEVMCLLWVSERSLQAWRSRRHSILTHSCETNQEANPPGQTTSCSSSSLSFFLSLFLSLPPSISIYRYIDRYT